MQSANAQTGANRLPSEQFGNIYLETGSGIAQYGSDFDNDWAGMVNLYFAKPDIYGILKPFAGVTSATNGSIYGYGGIYADFLFRENLFLTPSFAIGAHSRDGRRDLGHVLEFRSSLTTGWQFSNQTRIGAFVYHISNAGIGKVTQASMCMGISLRFSLGGGDAPERLTARQ